ncbi:MAG: IS66 family insertion sequence element accessory protein TnpA, partial [Gammaproteobacteria bacterium]
MTRADKRAQWRERLDQWRQSGLSQTAYCTRHDLKLATFRYWRQQLRDEAVPSPRFIALGAANGISTGEPRLTLRAGALHFDIPV